ncbi:hypothetical protein Tco_0653158 [Tanacetum coccineum]|uniref:Uncharacterized protein n=1 Tax=Tanacetum coccineum TaxID=301880 RepID=A0ABQ4WZR2_9ASTR
MRLASRCSRLRWQCFERLTVGLFPHMRREISDMHAELLTQREQQRRARQPGSDARAPDHQEASRDADSHI